jgi:hypothetical protein
MTAIDQFLGDAVGAALGELRDDPIPVYTFAFYHDHESGAVSICVDTIENSSEAILRSNDWSMKHFNEHIRSGELGDASLFQANTGRNLSLGDFAKMNLARTDLPDEIELNDDFYLGMVRSVMNRQEEILDLSEDRDRVLFCASTKDAEVGNVWSRIRSAEQGEDTNPPPLRS